MSRFRLDETLTYPDIIHFAFVTRHGHICIYLYILHVVAGFIVSIVSLASCVLVSRR